MNYGTFAWHLVLAVFIASVTYWLVAIINVGNEKCYRIEPYEPDCDADDENLPYIIGGGAFTVLTLGVGVYSARKE